MRAYAMKQIGLTDNDRPLTAVETLSHGDFGF